MCRKYGAKGNKTCDTGCFVACALKTRNILLRTPEAGKAQVQSAWKKLADEKRNALPATLEIIKFISCK
jgi:hypothetical protein